MNSKSKSPNCTLSPGIGISLRYVGYVAIPRSRLGILAVFEKKSTFFARVKENLNPTGDKKFLFSC